MGECGEGELCPHFGLFGKTRGSNQGDEHKVELQLIFPRREAGWIRGRATKNRWLPFFLCVGFGQIITYLDFDLTAFSHRQCRRASLCE